MGRSTSIEWTSHTWNPLLGCSIESAGCTNCYAMRLAHRLGAMGQAGYAGLTRRTKGGAVWTGELRLASAAQLDKPRRIARPALIFVNSMSDLFHPDAPDEWREATYRVMLETPRHTYQVLTKRPQVAARYYAARPELHGLPHIWIGVSVENARVLERIDILRARPRR
jgi:protein gp37